MYSPRACVLCRPPPEGPDVDTSEQPQSLPPTPQKEGAQEGEREGAEGELKKQEMLVQYLRDTESFSLQVEKAIAVINTMLYWKTTTGRHVYKSPWVDMTCDRQPSEHCRK